MGGLCERKCILLITKKREELETLLVIENIKSKRYHEINQLFVKKRPHDLAIIFQSLPERYRAALLHHLEVPTLARMMHKLNKTHQLELLSKIGPEKANKVLALLDTSVLTTLLRKYPKADLELFLSEIEETDSIYIKRMIEYPTDSAGSLMTNRYISITELSTVSEAIEKIKTLALYSESVNHLYITDNNGKLIGLVSYRDLIIANRHEKINNIMLEQVIGVNVSTKRTEILRLLKHYDFSALPVTDNDGILLGMITFDDMVEIIIHETSDDYSKLSAASKEIDFDTKPFTAAYRRLPWLIILLFIGLVSGSIISNFEATLEKVVSLAFFMPLIAGMTGNTGTQSLAVVVRGLAEREIDMKIVLKLILRSLGKFIDWVYVWISYFGYCLHLARKYLFRYGRWRLSRAYINIRNNGWHGHSTYFV